MVAGSFASTYYGEPRTTHDIDVVMSPNVRGLLAVTGLRGATSFNTVVVATELGNPGVRHAEEHFFPGPRPEVRWRP